MSPTRRTHRPAIASIALALALAAPLAACGSSDDDAAPASTTNSASTTVSLSASTSAPTTAAPSTTAPSTSAPATGCRPTSGGIPAGAGTAPIPDVDGDGRRDTGWFAPPADGVRRFGITTASGATTSIEVPLAAPIPLRALVADADQQPPSEILISDNRTVLLEGFVDCSIVPITNPEGETYAFDLGFRGTGTGVGCVDADGDGRRDLVGVLRVLAATPEGDSGEVRWTRTIIRIDGTHASNGARDSGSYPADDTEAIELLSQVTCGDRTLADGPAEPR